MRANLNAANFMPEETDGLRLKLWLAKKVEAELDKISAETRGKVSAINFTFHNSWVLDMLREKGDYIKWQEWKKLNVLNKELTRRIKENMQDAANQQSANMYNKTDYKKSICDPISAFVSVETEEAYNLLAGVQTITLGNEDSQVREALEPTNIIWENYDFDEATRSRRYMMIIGTICFVLFLTFCVTFKAKASTKILIGKYDMSIKCSELSRIYSYPQMSQLAADEWIDYYKNGGEEMERQISGTLACFCQAE